MLLALVVRGGVLEFRWQSNKHRLFWDALFFLRSFVATIFQGLILGSFLQDIAVINNAYAVGPFDWLTPFSAGRLIAQNNLPMQSKRQGK